MTKNPQNNHAVVNEIAIRKADGTNNLPVENVELP